MTNVQPYPTELGIPLIQLSGRTDEKSGAELANKIMASIHHYTSTEEYPHPMSLVAPFVVDAEEHAPEDGS